MEPFFIGFWVTKLSKTGSLSSEVSFEKLTQSGCYQNSLFLTILTI